MYLKKQKEKELKDEKEKDEILFKEKEKLEARKQQEAQANLIAGEEIEATKADYKRNLKINSHMQKQRQMAVKEMEDKAKEFAEMKKRVDLKLGRNNEDLMR